jgi:hypothetical protein
MCKLKRCFWILSIFRDRGGALSLKELNEIYQRSSIYDGAPILARTFYRDRIFLEQVTPFWFEWNRTIRRYELFCSMKYGEDLAIYKHLISN